MPRAREVPALREVAVEAGAAVLEARLLAAHAEGHARLAALHPELAQDSNQVGIGPFVEDDEAGVDVVSLAGVLLQDFEAFVLSDGLDVWGSSALYLPSLVLVIGIFAIGYSFAASKKGWLT